MWNVVLVLAGVLLLGYVALRLTTRPTNDRAWRPEQARLPHVTFDSSRVHVRDVRDFTFRSATDFTPAYRDRTYDLDKLQRVWFVLSPFSREWRGPAHTFLTFGFSDGQYVSISVEARREASETYSIWKGALRQYELMYVIGEERDVIGVRAVTQDDPVYLYPARATPGQARALFVAMLQRAQEIERAPVFYNTLTNNCTTNILRPVNALLDNDIPIGLGIVLPGYSDKLALERGLIDTDLPLEQARAAFQANDRARAAIHSPDFSARIRS
ncbi:DUF4105 domain-containing protein [Longimicrobium sp.]|uniref:lipoprotein N-acyltransferase Lnb domain-containing protein n=1 Tax=Longimicrobium sp. TaxID=2029185 RepID=UPI002E3346CD|nr:DUF4105 domain-containing protein [Longimicrobium sp.]HEX6040122.1 DUF4105 domain-containing protein [Longimicrobium sp.]